MTQVMILVDCVIVVSFVSIFFIGIYVGKTIEKRKRIKKE